MKQEYLDGIILRVIEESGNDPDVREDFVRRILRNQLKRVVPGCFFQVKSLKCNIINGLIESPNDCLSIIAIDNIDKSTVKRLYLYSEKVYFPNNDNVQDYMTDSDLLRHCQLLGKYAFSEDQLSNEVIVFTEEQEVIVFYYSQYEDKNGRVVVPEFSADYLTSYGTMRTLEVQLNKGLKGRTPTSVTQTRYTLQDVKKKVTNQYLTMQRTINLLTDKVIIKPVNSDGDVSTF